MMKLRLLVITAPLLALSPVAFSADASACMNCHDDGEFAGMSTADIIADTRDPGIPPHKRFSNMSDEDLQAIAAKLAGS
jgi:hypothetical protein